MDQTTGIPAIVVMIACCMACATDIREYKIRNILTFPLLISALLYHGFHGGWPEFGMSSYGALVGFGVFFIPYITGIMGAGDVKLMAAVGAWLGGPATFIIAVFGCLAAGIYSAYVLIRQKRLRDSWTAMQLFWRRFTMIAQHLALDDEQGCVRSEVRHPERRRRLIPFSVMITIGVLTLFVMVIWIKPTTLEKLNSTQTPNGASVVQ
jgi:prepilin peptidase CpaA